MGIFLVNQSDKQQRIAIVFPIAKWNWRSNKVLRIKKYESEGLVSVVKTKNTEYHDKIPSRSSMILIVE